MLVSNVFDETTFLSPAIPSLPQFRESPQANDFDGRNVLLQDSHKSLVRASVFFKYLERNLDAPKGSKSPLQALLERSFHIPASEENKSLFSEITHAFFKQKGYLLRLFSNESWNEWVDNRTALGKVASQFSNCIESRAEVCSITRVRNPQLIQQANEESSVLLKGLDSHEVTRTSKSSCFYGLTSGIAASFLLENPLPLLMGLSECFPRVYAQQKVGNEFQVNSYVTNSQMRPSVASFSNGNFVVAWHSWLQDGSSDGVYGQLFDGNGSYIGSEFQVNSYVTNAQMRPSVASFSNGNFVVTWESWLQDGSNNGVYGQLFDGNGSNIGSEFRANSYVTLNQQYSSVASFSNGNFVVAWMSDVQDGSNDGVYGQLFDGNGSNIGSEFQVNSYVTNSQQQPSVASFSNGNFVVTWYSWLQDGSGDGVYGQLFDGNGTKIGSEFLANSYTQYSQLHPSVASFSNGNFVVTWESSEQDGSAEGVYGQLFDGNGSTIGSEFRANSYTTNNQLHPSVASFSNGNFVVAWDSAQDGSGSGIYGQLFDGNGTKIGSEFLANSYTTNAQVRPSVASFSNGNFVVTWMSYLQDGADGGIYGQIFHDNITYPSSSTSTSSSTTSTSTTSSSTSSVSSSTTVPSTSTTSSTTSSIRSSSTSTSTTSSTALTTSTSSTRSSIYPFSNESTEQSKTPTPLLWRTILWISVGVGGLFCFCVTSFGYLLIRKRKPQTETKFSEEMRPSTIEFELEPVVQRHKLIGKAYFQLSKVSKEEAEEIYLQTGHLIPFPEEQKKYRYVIGSGQFGKIKVAQRKEDGVFVASKKVKGEENMRASDAEAQMQKDAAGDNVLPIYNTIRLEEALYHFMPLAGLGDGTTIQKRLALLNQSPLALEIIRLIAQNILTGLQTIHAKGIYHLDMKPDNLVFTKDGTAYITDFGCAKRLEDPQLTGEAMGDNRYFSPERLSACKEGTFDAEKADMWAAGVALMQIFYNKDPLELLKMPQRLLARVEKCDQAHFDEQLQQFSEVQEGSIWWVIKGLLDTNPKTRLTATQALQARCFHGLDQTQQESAFEDLRRETFAQHRGIETSQVNLSNYGWVRQMAPEEEKAQKYQSTINQEFYGYKLTPEGYQLTPDHVTAGSSSSSGHQLIP